ncbi:MAG: FkbM family methyltransferase [Chloracidobacterium sp.]|nr:FkbM family methyltransferase [Chloracidobacterium sp.]
MDGVKIAGEVLEVSDPLPLKTRLLDGVRRVFTVNPFENGMLFLLRGVKYGGFWSRFIPGPHLYPHESKRTVTRDGINYELDISCMMQWYVFWDFKEKQRDRLYSFIKEGDVVFDVGTNIGETLLNFGGLVGSKGFVYGFEPDEKNFNNLQKNIGLNNFENLQVFNLGVSDRKERVKLHRVNQNNLGMNRILNETEAGKFEDFSEIETNTLDNIVVENHIQKIDLIKIDIEGYEMHALRGAHQLLQTFRPKLFIEVGYTRLLDLGTSPLEMVAYLHKFGYRIFHAETDEAVDEKYDFSPLGDGGIDVYAVADAV